MVFSPIWGCSFDLINFLGLMLWLGFSGLLNSLWIDRERIRCFLIESEDIKAGFILLRDLLQSKVLLLFFSAFVLLELVL